MEGVGKTLEFKSTLFHSRWEGEVWSVVFTVDQIGTIDRVNGKFKGHRINGRFYSRGLCKLTFSSQSTHYFVLILVLLLILVG